MFLASVNKGLSAYLAGYPTFSIPYPAAISAIRLDTGYKKAGCLLDTICGYHQVCFIMFFKNYFSEDSYSS